MYSDFYEIPLPALRFEKVEETDTKKWKRHRRETTPSKFDQSQETERKTTLKTTLKEKQIHSLDKVKKPKEKTTLTTLKEKQIHSQENDTQSRLKHASRQKNLL